jgi:hypothetical protein
VLSLGTLLLTSTIPVIFLYPPLTGFEFNPISYAWSTFDFRVLAYHRFPFGTNVVPFRFSFEVEKRAALPTIPETH